VTAPYEPAGHGSAVADVEPARQKKPMEQLPLHALEFSAGFAPKVPAGQRPEQVLLTWPATSP
jgi:hypothetical protein